MRSENSDNQITKGLKGSWITCCSIPQCKHQGKIPELVLGGAAAIRLSEDCFCFLCDITKPQFVRYDDVGASAPVWACVTRVPLPRKDAVDADFHPRFLRVTTGYHQQPLPPVCPDWHCQVMLWHSVCWKSFTWAEPPQPQWQATPLCG